MRARAIGPLLAVVTAAVPCPAEARSARFLVERPQAPAGAHLVALAGGQLIAYDDSGRANLRKNGGTWTGEFQLPVTSVWALVPDGVGLLLSGQGADGQQLVVLCDASAVEQRRWIVSDALSRLFVTANRRWAVQMRGMVELLPDGQVGPLEPFPDAHAPRYGDGPPLIFDRAGARWTCWGANDTEAHSASATCQRTGGERWYLRGAGRDPPILCGDWLIEYLAPEYRDLGVWSLQGKRVARRRYPSVPLFSCAGANAVVVGSRQLDVAELPSLRPRWTGGVRGPKVVAVAAVGKSVIYTTEGTRDGLKDSISPVH